MKRVVLFALLFAAVAATAHAQAMAPLENRNYVCDYTNPTMGEVDYGVSSKLNPDWRFLCHLRDVGRERAARWIDATIDRLGVESTIDIREEFL